jgi:hypothetical protein
MQGDPTTCQFILSEEQYEGTYGRVNTPTVMRDCCSGDEVDDLDELKQAMDEEKVRVDSVVTELCQLKVQVQKMKMTAICGKVRVDSVVTELCQLKVQVQKMKMTAICVAVGCGCVTTTICGVAIGLVMSRMW